MRREPESSRCRREVILELLDALETRGRMVAPHRVVPSAEMQCLEITHQRRQRLEQLQLKRNCQWRNHRSQTMIGQALRTDHPQPAGAGCTSLMLWCRSSVLR